MNLSLWSELLEMSRQNLYKTYLHSDPSKRQFQELLIASIENVLSDHKGYSGSQIGRELAAQNMVVSKEALYRVINKYKLTLNSGKKSWKSKHYKLKASPNLVSNKTFRRVFEVLFADYTEIRTNEGKLQLLLIEDLISRYITAFRISASCTSGPVVEALTESMELKHSLKLTYKTILHTDRGSEFVNYAVRRTAEKYGIVLSNTGINRCYENAFLESLNKTLKHTLGLRIQYGTKQEAVAEITATTEKYNSAHKHGSLGKRTPYCILMNYTAKKSRNPEEKPRSCHPTGRVARIYSKSLKVKIKQIRLDNKHKAK